MPTTVLTPIILWNIWKTGNSNLFKPHPPNNITKIFLNISFQELEFLHISNTSEKNLPKQSIPITWLKPLDEYLKLIIDGSFEPKTTNGGTRGVIRNQAGE
ncbi:hypothetical protein H5410_055870 [Solanum commersonii]|uniref:Uncharacterized protein n=1 Tax=Solanum commersonii TaxID=4109 RepID=A0A9J5WL33_SOLCO|nr:hypothetical protein H5410_055870 [Solanum commersonii]